VLPNIADEFHGVVGEHTYIAEHFPTWHIEYQTTLEHNDRRYDVLGMIKPDMTKVALYFDITEWFGKKPLGHTDQWPAGGGRSETDASVVSSRKVNVSCRYRRTAVSVWLR